MLQLNIGPRACPQGKHSQTVCKHFFPRLVFTLMLIGVNLNLCVYLLLSSAARYVVAALLNTSSSDKMFDSLSFIFSGIRLTMLGG